MVGGMEGGRGVDEVHNAAAGAVEWCTGTPAQETIGGSSGMLASEIHAHR